MKIKLKLLLESSDGLGDLISKDIPVAVAFKLAGLSNVAQTHLENFQNQKTKFLQAHHNAEEIEKEMNDVLDVDIELPDTQVTLQELGDIKIKPSSLMSLREWLLTDATFVPPNQMRLPPPVNPPPA
jgi:hypothetical protein